MAKKALIEKEKRREKMVKRRWDERKELRQRSKDVNLSQEEREEARLKLNKMPRDTCPARLRFRCQLTGRPRGNLRKFAVSRICFRELASAGLIPGVTKASW